MFGLRLYFFFFSTIQLMIRIAIAMYRSLFSVSDSFHFDFDAVAQFINDLQVSHRFIEPNTADLLFLYA